MAVFIGGIGTTKRKSGNVPRIEKQVKTINELIKKVKSLNGYVIDKTSTFESPEMYEPLKYSNGVLYETIKDYRGNVQKYKYLKDDLALGGSPLANISRMHRRALKHYEKYGEFE